MAMTASKPPPHSELFVFNWAKEKMGWLYVVVFLIFSMTIHGAGFYLFQVVYPSPSRVEPDLDSVMLMDVSNPEVRLLLRRIQDRAIYLKPPSEQSDVRIRLEDYPVRFTPSFQRTVIQPIPPSFPWSISFQGGGAVDKPDLADLCFDDSATSAMSFDSSLAERTVAPWSIMVDYLGRAESVPAFRAKVRISREGMVRVEKIESELEESDRKELSVVIESTLRFLPAASVTTGWLDVWAQG
mgnify:CR=1 FL=1|tara:strand:+ start:2222 stop:2944 length:723 start_codon:yes stop_codon:yes gene_type:complete